MKKMKNNTTSNSEMVIISWAEYEELQSNLQSFKHENAELTDKVEYLMEQLSYLFNDAEVYAPPASRGIVLPCLWHQEG